MTALFFLLVVVTGWAVRSWAGDLAGILAAALVAFEPNLLAHAGVVHTDLAAALGFFGTLVLALRALERRSLGLWAATGAALGASLAAKFSCVLLVPMVALLALTGLFRERRAAAREGRRPDLLELKGLLLAGAASLVVLLGSYAIAMRHMSGDEAARPCGFFSTRDRLRRRPPIGSSRSRGCPRRPATMPRASRGSPSRTGRAAV